LWYAVSLRILEYESKNASRLDEGLMNNFDGKLYVGGLSYNTTEEELSAHFAQAGTVKSVHIATDKDTGRSRGFGFVEMSTQEETDKAIQMFDGKELGGRSLTVNPAKPREERGSGRNSGRGTFGGNNFDKGNRGFGGGGNKGGNWDNARRGGSSGHRGGHRG
jgi:cold-inducible RNA-binding protein